MDTALPRLKPRQSESHKGDYGRALLMGGSRGMSGAIGLAGMSCLRSGAGLVRLAVPSVCLDSVAAYEPSYMTAPLDCDNEGRIAAAAIPQIDALSSGVDCLACGPGLGRSTELAQVVGDLYTRTPQPLVLDADALYAMSQSQADWKIHAGTRIITPHPGEFRRLTKQTPGDRTVEERIADEFALANDVIVVLKGHRTWITDGRRTARNETGNPGMATGGSGDVLTGIVVALVCQGMEPFEAARLAAHVHGLAGDLAARDLGMVSLIASDLVRYLPQAFQNLS